ncbi:MAG: hypothetical protein KAR38_09740, partial [Calditrichia bacterium]|nr:hypothetical protein [Calditrichia bacterium]
MEELLKSKAQLIEELNNLRKRVSELETIKKQKEDIEEKFNLFMDHLPGCAFIKDLKGKYLYLNKY